MAGFVSEIVYRPILLPLLLLVWAIVASVCLGLSPVAIILSAFLLIFFYYFLLRCQKIRPSCCRFLLLGCLTLLVVWFVAQRISERRTQFLVARSLLAKDFHPGKKVTVSGRIATLPQGSPAGWRLRFTPLNGILASFGDVQLYLPTTAYDDVRLPLVGDIVTLQIELLPLKPARHPFLRGRLRSQLLSGLVARGKLENFSKLKIEKASSSILARIEKIRRSLYRSLAAASGDIRSAAILQAVLIGCRDQLSLKTKDLFLDFGVFHLFAISGLHLSVVVTLFFFLVKVSIPDFIRRRLVKGTTPIAAAATILFLPVYIFLAGLHLPVVRAGIMALFFLAALLSGRLRDVFSALFGAALVILLVWPEALFALSFQLSFTAVATILWVAPRAREWWQLWLSAENHKTPGRWQIFFRNIFYLAASSAAISLTTAPLLINRVHFLSLYSLFANIILIPLFSFIIIPLGMLSLLFVKLPVVMSLLLKPLVLILHTLIDAGMLLQKWLPAGRIYFSTLTTFEMILVVSVIIVGCWLLTPASHKKVTGLTLMLLCLTLLGDFSWWYCRQNREQLAVAAFVGGRPQVLLFELPGGEALLFNGGSWSGSSGTLESLAGGSFFSFAKNVIAPYCWRRKIKRIDTLVLTEPQSGLVGGLLFLVEHFKIREIWYHGIWSGYPPFKNFCKISQDRFGVRWQKISSLSYPFSLNGVEIDVVGPPANDFKFSTLYSESIRGMAPSLLLRYGNFSSLIWGGGQLDPAVMPERVDLLALLRPCGTEPSVDLTAVTIAQGGWLLHPGSDGKCLSDYWEASSWDVKRDGFLFLEADLSGKITNKLPASLISGCQAGLDKL